MQIPTQQEALVAATMTAQVWPRWQFCEFVEHVLACAEGAGCDAALFSQETASARLPDWVWKPIEGIGVAMTTGLAWGKNASRTTPAAAGVIQDLARANPEPRTAVGVGG